MKSLRWIPFLCLLLCQIAQAQERIGWTLVGTLNHDVAALFRVTNYENRLSIDAAILLRRTPDSPREIPDAYHPNGGALLSSHSVYYESATHTVWIDGKSIFRLDAPKIVMLVESEQPKQPPTVTATELIDQEIRWEEPVTMAELREFLMRFDSVRAFADRRISDH